MKKPKNYKWQKNDGIGTMSWHLRSEHELGPEGEEGSSGGGQAQLHGYASDMPGTEYGLRKKVIALDTPTRWNSTYKLLHDAIAYRDVLTNMYNESRATNGQFITNDHWSLAKNVHDVLETFDNATHIFSYVYEPNIHTVILECIKIICTIKQTSLANPGAAVKRLPDIMKVSNSKHILERLCEDYGVVIQPQPVRSSM
ncbi:putative AC transposase, partial [Bienertia sinuspersici]